jgi:hypothetical protein
MKYAYPKNLFHANFSYIKDLYVKITSRKSWNVNCKEKISLPWPWPWGVPDRAFSKFLDLSFISLSLALWILRQPPLALPDPSASQPTLLLRPSTPAYKLLRRLATPSSYPTSVTSPSLISFCSWRAAASLHAPWRDEARFGARRPPSLRRCRAGSQHRGGSGPAAGLCLTCSSASESWGTRPLLHRKAAQASSPGLWAPSPIFYSLYGWPSHCSTCAGSGTAAAVGAWVPVVPGRSRCGGEVERTQISCCLRAGCTLAVIDSYNGAAASLPASEHGT